MANSNGWGDGAANNAIGWGQGANNAIAWGDSHAKSWAGATDIVGLTTDPDAQAFITAAAITDPTQQLAIDNLVKGLKSDNIWTKMKAIYPFVGGTASTHKWNLKDPRDLDAAFRLVFNGGWTHSSTGATPNGTNGYADTKLNQLANLTASNNHISFYSRTDVVTSTPVEAGCTNGATFSFSQLSTKLTGNAVYENGSQTMSVANANSQGLYIGTSTSSTSAKLYKNGTSIASSTTAQTRTMFNLNVFVGSSNLNGTAFYFSSKQSAFTSIGDGLTDTEASNLYTRVQAYQTALSRNV